MDYENAANYKPITADKPFAVVKFLQCTDAENAHSEVPTEWVSKFQDKDDTPLYMCWWPDTENKNRLTNLISSKAEFNKQTWKQLAVEFDTYCSTYQSARKRATDANYATTDENLLGRGNRTKKPRHLDEDEVDVPNQKKKRSASQNYVHVDQGTDSDEDLNLSLLPTPPETNLNPTATSVTPMQKKNKELDMTSKDIDLGTDHENQDEEVFASPNKQSIYSMFQRTVRLCAEIRMDVKDLTTRVTNLEKKDKVYVENELDLIADLLPLSNPNQVLEFNQKLNDNAEWKQIFEKFILQVGGTGAKQNIYNVLVKVIKDKCAMKYTWKGCITKPSAKKLRCMQQIKASLCRFHCTLTEAEFDAHASEWFRCAKQRYTRAKAKRVKILQRNANDEAAV